MLIEQYYQTDLTILADVWIVKFQLNFAVIERGALFLIINFMSL